MPNQNNQASLHHSAPFIGYHRSALSQKFGAPRQPNLVALSSIIEMIAPFDTPDAFVGLADFSHIWVSWQFHHNHIKQNDIKNNNDVQQNDVKQNDIKQNKAPNFRSQVRPPRLGGNQKVGVFASRSMYRPSALGLSVVKLERIEVIEGRVLLIISGADMIDGTPIIDIKPYIAYSDALMDAHSGFAASAPISLTVSITELAHAQFLSLVDKNLADSDNAINFKNTAHINKHQSIADTIFEHQTKLIHADIDMIKDLIAQDPRPAYRRDELEVSFTMRYKSVDVSFWQIDKHHLQIIAITPVD